MLHPFRLTTHIAVIVNMNVLNGYSFMIIAFSGVLYAPYFVTFLENFSEFYLTAISDELIWYKLL